MTKFLIKKWVKNANRTEDPQVRDAYGKLASITGIVCNLIISVSKIVLGILVGSVAITADGVNNLSDASASVISFVGFKLAGRPADEEHPYGHGRYEYLSALLVAIFVAVIGVELFKSSLTKVIEPTPVVFRLYTVVILSFSLLVKSWMFFFYRKIGRIIDSGALLAASTDSRNDIVATSAVLLSALVSHFTSLEVDGYVGMGVAVFILYSSYGLIRSTLDPMLGAAPDPAFVEKIREKIMGYPEVLGIHDLLIHDYGPGRQFGSVHIEMAAEGDVLLHHDIIDTIERDCLKSLGLHIIIHYDPIVVADSTTGELRCWLAEAVKEKIDPCLSIHDLRIITGGGKTDLIFDVAAPYSFSMSDADIRVAIQQLIACRYPDYVPVITVDRIQSYMPH